MGCRLLVLWLAVVSGHLPQEREITITVGPGKEECFFEEVVKGNTLTIEYQVMLVTASHEDLTVVSFYRRFLTAVTARCLSWTSTSGCSPLEDIPS